MEHDAEDIAFFEPGASKLVIACQCVTCSECRGSGRVNVETRGYPEFELETCPECDGTGISEFCADCTEKELDREDEY